MRVAECEFLVASSGVRGTIRAGQYSRLSTALETGGQEGQWTLPRYRNWLDSRTDWVMPGDRSNEPVPADLPVVEPVRVPVKPPPAAAKPVARPPAKTEKRPGTPASDTTDDGVLVINEVDEDPAAILERMQRRR
jgi:hypothetical protein